MKIPFPLPFQTRGFTATHLKVIKSVVLWLLMQFALSLSPLRHKALCGPCTTLRVIQPYGDHVWNSYALKWPERSAIPVLMGNTNYSVSYGPDTPDF